MKNRDAHFIWWGIEVHPQIVHYATYNTWTHKYLRYHLKVEHLYKRTWKPFVWIHFVVASICWGIKPRQLRRFFKWLGAHFTISWIKYRWGKLKGRFTKKNKS